MQWWKWNTLWGPPKAFWRSCLRLQIKEICSSLKTRPFPPLSSLLPLSRGGGCLAIWPKRTQNCSMIGFFNCCNANSRAFSSFIRLDYITIWVWLPRNGTHRLRGLGGIRKRHTLGISFSQMDRLPWTPWEHTTFSWWVRSWWASCQ